jgi:hypothetical protein
MGIIERRIIIQSPPRRSEASRRSGGVSPAAAGHRKEICRCMICPARYDTAVFVVAGGYIDDGTPYWGHTPPFFLFTTT